MWPLCCQDKQRPRCCGSDRLSRKNWRLRFPDPQEEDRFRKYQEPFVVRYVSLSAPVSVATTVAIGLFRWHQRVPLGGVSDPQYWMYLGLTANTVYHSVLLILALFFSQQKLLAGRWEALATFTSTLDALGVWLFSPWHIAVLLGRSPEDEWPFETKHLEFLCISCMLVVANVFSYFSTVRTCRMYVVPMLSFLSYCAVLCFIGSPFPTGALFNVWYVGISCAFAYIGCWRHEHHLRQEWKASLEVVEMDKQLVDIRQVNKAFSAMAGTTSDIVLMMDRALRVILSDESHEAYFGRPVNNLPLDQLLVEDDRPRFFMLVQAAAVSGSLQSMPASLTLGSGGIQNTQMAIISTTSGDGGKYLVGLHFDSSNPVQEATLAFPARTDAPLSTLAEDREEKDGDSEDLRSQSTFADSFATTTNTGHLFADLDAAVHMDSLEGRSHDLSRVQQKLRQIAKLGVTEHWLVPPEDLELMPSPELGHGGFSTVLFGRVRGSPVAVKVPRIVENTPAGLLNSLANEIRVNRHVRHANIALFYGACIDPKSGSMLLLYELVAGVSLSKYITKMADTFKGGVQETARVKILLDVGCALNHLHSLFPSVVHGDIKGDNVMVEQRHSVPHAKLLDFGLSRVRTRQARPLGGTRCWMAPEVTQPGPSGPHPQPAADVFSFGWLAYFVMTGIHPKNAVDEAVFKSVGKDDPPLFEPPLRWPERAQATSSFPKVKSLVAQCLVFEPLQRPGMAAALKNILTWLPQQESLSKLGPSIISLLSDGWVPCAVGIEAILKEPHSDQCRSGPLTAPPSPELTTAL